MGGKQRFYLDIVAYALRFAHQKKCAIIHQRKIGVRESCGHHRKATGHWGLLWRPKAALRELRKKIAFDSVAKNLPAYLNDKLTSGV